MSVFESLPVTPRSRGLHAPAGLARTAAPAAVLAAGLLLAVGVATPPRSSAPSLPLAIKPGPRPAMRPALYVPNTGQASAGVLFERRGGGGMLPFSRDEAASGGVVMRLDGARAAVRVAGSRRLRGGVNGPRDRQPRARRRRHRPRRRALGLADRSAHLRRRRLPRPVPRHRRALRRG